MTKSVQQKFIDTCKSIGEPVCENRAKAYANFDKPGWTKFQLVHLIIKQSEEIGKLEDKLNN